MTKKQSVTPVLSASAGYIEDVRDQVASLVRYVIMNPGFTSSLWENDLISFRKLASTYEGSRNEMIYFLSEKIKTILSAKFRDYYFDTDFKTEDYESGVPDGRYTVKFNISIAPITDQTLTTSALVSGTIEVDMEKNDIILSYDKSLDNLTI